MTTSWQGAAIDLHRRDRMGDRVDPGAADLLDRPAHADGVDLRRCRQRADRDGHVVAPSAAIDDVGEQERAALVLGQSALELPAHQRVQLGVLVDRPVDARHEPLRLKPRQVLLEIERGTCGVFCRAALVGLVEHGLPHPVSRAQRSTSGAK